MKTLIDDWNKHKHSSLRPLFALWTYRFGRFALHSDNWIVRKVLGIIYLLVQPFGEFIGGIYLYRDTNLGAEPHFIHAGNIQINPKAVIGDRVGFMHGVTIGVEPSDSTYPVIGDDVFLGANCTVLGGVKVGNGATISANSLVITDVPEGALAIGVPAKMLPKGAFSAPKK
ncbi:MAG: serine O-acetyltransferase [Cellvibrionaceae bacterium]